LVIYFIDFVKLAAIKSSLFLMGLLVYTAKKQ